MRWSYEPEKDITIYELAVCMGILFAVMLGGHELTEIDAEECVKRHFKRREAA